ncbi:MAG: hypothetical protein QM660_07230 [Dysgonomonas sp.]
MEKNKIKRKLEDMILIPVVVSILIAVMWLCNHLSSFVLGLN